MSKIAGPFRQFYLPLRARPQAKPGLREMFSRYIAKEDVVIEVGAYQGGSTVELAKIAKHVYSFEPSPINFKVLKHTTRLLQNVSVFPFAVGKEKAMVKLNVPSKYSSVATGTVSSIGNQNVSQVSLDDMSWSLRPNVLVLDCEGSEVDALQGATKTLSFIRLILSEFWIETEEATKSKSFSLGFQNQEILRVHNWHWLAAKRV